MRVGVYHTRRQRPSSAVNYGRIRRVNGDGRNFFDQVTFDQDAAGSQLVTDTVKYIDINEQSLRQFVIRRYYRSR